VLCSNLRRARLYRANPTRVRFREPKGAHATQRFVLRHSGARRVGAILKWRTEGQGARPLGISASGICVGRRPR
jgi:hypothetical protein